MATFICNLNDIPEGGSCGFELEGLSLVVVRQADQVFAYRNICPHVGTPLNWMPNQFMDYEKRHIQCSTHGALFEITTGLCIAGPCQGEHLQSVTIDIIEGQVFLV